MVDRRLSLADATSSTGSASDSTDSPVLTPRRGMVDNSTATAVATAPRRGLLVDDADEGIVFTPRRGLAEDAVNPLAFTTPRTTGRFTRKHVTGLVMAPVIAMAGVAAVGFALPNNSAATDTAALTAVPAATATSSATPTSDDARMLAAAKRPATTATKTTKATKKASAKTTVKATAKSTATKNATTKTMVKAVTVKKATTKQTVVKTSTKATAKTVVSNVKNIGVGECPIGGSANRTCNQAIAYMVAQMNSGANWHNSCLELVDAAYGGGLNTATSAIGAAYNVEAKGRMHYTTDYASIPRGAVLWFKSKPGVGNPKGHAAISIGGGYAISSDAPVNDGSVGIVPISFFITNWHKTLYGYSAG